MAVGGEWTGEYWGGGHNLNIMNEVYLRENEIFEQKTIS